MLSGSLTFSQDGYLNRAGRRFIPLGVNYWPGSCGTDMWTKWPESEMRRDLDRIAGLGLNCVRFFLLWQDFEPEEGKWNDHALKQLGSFLVWCKEAGLYAQPTLFVGWMSGATFWPEWKAGRNLFADVEMRQFSARFAKKIAETCRPYHEGLMGFDLGNELCCLYETHEAKPRDIVAWCKAVTNAIGEGCPEAWVMAGNEQGQIVGDTGWRLNQQEGLSCLSMHTYPVPAWHPVPFDGMPDPLARTLLPFYVKVARAFGPVMVQEFGTILTRSATMQREYLRPMLEECWRAGANGFLWWCWSDFTCTQHPYNKNSFEKDLGLVDLEGKVKPGPDQFLEFAREVQLAIPTPMRENEAALYWPEHYYDRDCPENPGNSPGRCSPRLIMAHYLMEREGLFTGVVRHNALATLNRQQVLVIAGTFLTATEIDRVRAWAETGGCVVWHGPDPYNMGSEFRRCAGFAATNFHLPNPLALEVHGSTWNLRHFPRNLRVAIDLCGGEVIFRSGDVPVGIIHQVGKGCVLTILADIEGSVMEDSSQMTKRDHWSIWYRGLIDIARNRALPAGGR